MWVQRWKVQIQFHKPTLLGRLPVYLSGFYSHSDPWKCPLIFTSCLLWCVYRQGISTNLLKEFKFYRIKFSGNFLQVTATVTVKATEVNAQSPKWKKSTEQMYMVSCQAEVIKLSNLLYNHFTGIKRLNHFD